jgi:hypothetical protein
MPQRTAEEWQAAAVRVLEDGPITVSHAAKLVPAANSHGYASASSLVRWIVHGKRGVFLDGARITGKTWWTSKAALARFWAGLAAREAGRYPEPGTVETPKQRETRGQADMRALEAFWNNRARETAEKEAERRRASSEACRREKAERERRHARQLAAKKMLQPMNGV